MRTQYRIRRSLGQRRRGRGARRICEECNFRDRLGRQAEDGDVIVLPPVAAGVPGGDRPALSAEGVALVPSALAQFEAVQDLALEQVEDRGLAVRATFG